MMLRDFLRYPSVFKKSVRGKMFLFYNLKLCPRENFIKMLPEGAITGPKNSRFGAFIKILKVAFDCQSPFLFSNQLCPRKISYFFKMTPQ